MSLLIYSPQCNHSLDIIDYINKHEQLKQIVKYHNINKMGIPPQYKNKITRVPTMLTKNGKLLVGNEIRNWLDKNGWEFVEEPMALINPSSLAQLANLSSSRSPYSPSNH